jgi:penicillin G amidase
MSLSTKFLRVLRYGLIALSLVIIVGISIGWWMFHRAEPDYSGHVPVSGLSSSVSIYRDHYGVPHIFAKNIDDAIRALGYTHASERFFQMEMQRRAGQGRLSEAIGPTMLGIDKFVRTLGLYRLSKTSYAALSPEAQSFFQAYADGVNAWIKSHTNRLPPEFLLLGIKPEPWNPVDSVVWGKLMGLQLSHNYKLEILRAELASKLTSDQMSQIFPLSNDAPITIAPHLKKGMLQHQKTDNDIPGEIHNVYGDVTDGLSGDPFAQLGKLTSLDHAASNEWVVAGSRTETGKPILANDPHLGLEAPILWYLARIVTPELSIKGATVPGLPIILLGQNDHIAWGFTTTGSDVEDLFIETVDPKNSTEYLIPHGSQSFDVRTEIIHVKGAHDVTLNVRTTRHGPVISDIDSEIASIAGEGKVIALSFTGLSEKDTTSEALMRLNRATNWDEFLQALSLYQTPPQNIVYADTAGNIGYINPGLVPVRKKGNGASPVDGASGDYDWTGAIPFTQLPRLYNPGSGFIFNANNAVVSPGSFYFVGMDWEEPYRAERLQEFFDTIDKHSLETSARMQSDHVSLVARQMIPYLLQLPPSNKRRADALALLKNWDGTMDKDRPEPLIFDAWLYQMHQMLLIKKTGNNLIERGPYAATSIASILANNVTAWCGTSLNTPAIDCRDIVGQALDGALDMLEKREDGGMDKWRWGNEQMTILRHKLYSHVPVLNDLTDLSVASSGDFYTLDRGGSFDVDEKHPFIRTHGGGFRGLYDLADPDKSRFMITTGESGHVLSPHYGDLVPLWNDVKSFTLSGTYEDLATQGLPRLVLEPTVPH